MNSQVFFLTLAIFGCALGNIIPLQASTSPKPIENAFVPHATYLNANSYIDNVPYGVATSPQVNKNSYALMPSSQSPLDAIVWFFTRVGAVVLGSTVLFILGGIFNIMVCSMTSFCSYDLQALSKMDNESVRALITPEKISTAAALVQDAIGKYNRLQREIQK